MVRAVGVHHVARRVVQHVAHDLVGVVGRHVPSKAQLLAQRVLLVADHGDLGDLCPAVGEVGDAAIPHG